MNKLLINENKLITDESGKILTFSENGVEINGLIEEYKVHSGENINAGDFVEFVNSSSSQIYTSGGYLAPTCILIDENTVFIAFSYSSNYLYGGIIVIENFDIVSTKIVKLNSTSYSCYYRPSCILLEPNKILIIHSYSSSSYLYGTIVEINGTEMTATSTQLSDIAYSCFDGSEIILLEPNKVFVAHRNGEGTNYYYLYGTIIEINGLELTATLNQLNTAKYSSYNKNPSCVLLEPNKVFIAHSSAGTFYANTHALVGTIVEINGTTATVLQSTTLKGDVSVRSGISCVLLEPNKVFVCCSMSNSYYMYGIIVEIDGTTMTQTITQLTNEKDDAIFDSHVKCILVEPNKAFILSKTSNLLLLRLIKVIIDGTNMSASEEIINNDVQSCYESGPDGVLLDNGNILCVHFYSSSRYLYGTIYFGDKVKQVTDTIKGVAKTSGTEGQTIQVYVPNN